MNAIIGASPKEKLRVALKDTLGHMTEKKRFQSEIMDFFGAALNVSPREPQPRAIVSGSPVFSLSSTTKLRDLRLLT
ncbi:hypothetical protein FRC02_005441 [Tulasnella sp. 418]|nr:hypothetical protein FRC02_005441 [Tulasnella sp. 418]